MTSTRERWPGAAPKIAALVDERFPVRRRLSDAIGVHESTLALWLNGKRTPELESFFRLTRALGISLGEELGDPPQTASLTIGGDDFISVPLVAAGVAAGHGAIPELPEDRRVYAFRRDYVRRAIGTGDPRDGTLVTVFLARNKQLGSSMLPTIQPGSLVLIDRRPVERITDRGIYLIEYPGLAEDGGLAIKRLTLEKRKAILVAESDNPEPRYYPRIIDLDGVRIGDIVKGRVILWSTEADEA